MLVETKMKRAVPFKARLDLSPVFACRDLLPGGMLHAKSLRVMV